MRVGSVVLLRQSAVSDVGKDQPGTSLAAISPGPVGLLEILGEPILHRVVESLRRADVDPIFVVADEQFRHHSALRGLSRGRINVVLSSGDLSAALRTAFKRCADHGADAVILAEASAYVELDVSLLVQSHQSNHRRATLVKDADGILPIVMVNCSDPEFATALVDRKLMFPEPIAVHHHCAYTNRLRTSNDLRRLAQDALEHRCRIRPNGEEVAPGVWLASTARIHPTARVVGPAYVGPNSRVKSGSVVGDCSSVERDCIVERGSVVTDSSILAGTFVGACLDMYHVVANQSYFVDLQRNIGMSLGDNLVGSTSLSSPQRSEGLRVEAGVNRESMRAVRSRLRGLFKRPEPVVALPARVSYRASEPWAGLKSISGTTDSTGI